jgi:5S rRNA maturation endonuclease (ribonuclease M5)
MIKQTMKKKKYLSYNQYQLKHLSDVICDDIESLLQALNLDNYKIFDKMITMSCPIHGGDNDSALNLYYKGDSYRGNWKCRTHGCEEIFKSSIIGFIRGCLSNHNGWTKPDDPMVSFNDALKFAIDFSKQDISKIKLSKKVKEKHNFVNAIQNISSEKTIQYPMVPRQLVRQSLDIPSAYFSSRGFSKEILTKYDIGECRGLGKEMSGRSVVPIYDNDMKGMIGCSGRSIFDKCDKCSCYHDKEKVCPTDKDKWLFSKWKHSKNFKTQECLYNFWFAKDHILKTKTVIVVESPGNVWRLEEAGIHNSVAILGSSLSSKQKMLLDISGAMNLITIMDNDEAGQKGAKNIYEKCHRTYNIKNINISAPDIADMTINQINEEISPHITGYII